MPASFNAIVPAQFDIRHDVACDDPIVDDVLAWLEARCLELPPMNPWLLDLKSMDEWVQARSEERLLGPATEII